MDRELVYVNDERMIFQPFNGYMVSLLLFEGWNSKKKKKGKRYNKLLSDTGRAQILFNSEFNN